MKTEFATLDTGVAPLSWTLGYCAKEVSRCKKDVPPAHRSTGAICALFLALLAGWPLASSAQNTHTLPLVLAAGIVGQEGFVRIINRSGQAGTVSMFAIDDTGARFGPVSLSLDAEETVNFNSRDLEQGNASKGLPAGVGDGRGHWRLELSTALTIKPSAYIRTADGFLTSMHDVTPQVANIHSVDFFNPASNMSKVSRLRIINPGTTPAQVEITGRDDAGDPAPGGPVYLTLAPGASRTLTAEALEGGWTNLEGGLGDGAGKWQLSVTANVAIEVMSLLRSRTGHLANLSTVRGVPGEPEEPGGPMAPGSTFRDCPECPEMVVVPAGNFLMGSRESEPGHYEVERPIHRVTIARPFAVGKYEVTRGEFGRFVSETGHSLGNSCWTIEAGRLLVRPDRDWRNPGFIQQDNHPVACVYWFEAKAFVRWLSEKTGQEYRLLSEAEWEYAARAGTTTSFYWGESVTVAQCLYANLADESAELDYSYPCFDGYARTAPVGSFLPNDFGLYDVAGNVREWVEDCWNNSYEGAPVDGSAWLRGECERRMQRGGGWSGFSNSFRSAVRGHFTTAERHGFLGFRVARTITP